MHIGNRETQLIADPFGQPLPIPLLLRLQIPQQRPLTTILQHNIQPLTLLTIQRLIKLHNIRMIQLSENIHLDPQHLLKLLLLNKKLLFEFLTVYDLHGVEALGVASELDDALRALPEQLGEGVLVYDDGLV